MSRIWGLCYGRPECIWYRWVRSVFVTKRVLGCNVPLWVGEGLACGEEVEGEDETVFGEGGEGGFYCADLHVCSGDA